VREEAHPPLAADAVGAHLQCWRGGTAATHTARASETRVHAGKHRIACTTRTHTPACGSARGAASTRTRRAQRGRRPGAGSSRSAGHWRVERAVRQVLCQPRVRACTAPVTQLHTHLLLASVAGCASSSHHVTLHAWHPVVALRKCWHSPAETQGRLCPSICSA
jgi:hypothetical protein